MPADARDELLHAARVLQQIDAEAAQTCPTCGGAGITELPTDPGRRFAVLRQHRRDR